MNILVKNIVLNWKKNVLTHFIQEEANVHYNFSGVSHSINITVQTTRHTTTRHYLHEKDMDMEKYYS